MNGNEIIGVYGLVLVLLLFLTGIELGFAMALIGFLGFSYLNVVQVGPSTSSPKTFST